ncbi:MAG: formylglycine-generating enzyme family protein [Chloroflexi bacterium]|nr:formylglycine-generating enzyme family protein [Chloroflexota bacterium]
MKRLLLILVVVGLFVVGCDSGGNSDNEQLPTYTSPSGITMVSIPSGTFNMGTDDSWDNERPVHSVTLSPFNISAYEITYAQWMEVKTWAEANGYTFNMPGAMGGSEDYDVSHGMEDETHPVTTIEWYDTVLWCNALSEMEGRTPCYYTSETQSTVYRSGRVDIQNEWVEWNANGYRLPTEAEWEYSYRANTTTKYSFDYSINSNDANYLGNENGTTPVGSYCPNYWGLYDMAGNVWEWCWDWYDSGYYNNSPSKNPVGPSVGSDRVGRGGSWYPYAVFLRSDLSRIYDPDSNVYYLGFRPVSSQ